MTRDWGRYWDWLTQSALPLWASNGVDRARRGFEELLGLDGQPVATPRRCRVQGRQSFVFATAGKLGWAGPWQNIAGLGLDYLDRHYRRPDGLYATLAGPDGVLVDQTAMTYDQAFILLAMAALQEQDMGPGEGRALGLLDRIEALRRHPQGGFIEPGPRFLSNPHMHLLEAALAWMEAGGQPRWRSLAQEIVSLALASFVDPGRGALLEQFDANWAPAPGDAGQIVEPGHLFEWAWLLERWALLSAQVAAHDAAVQLFTAGVACIDPARRAAIDEVDPLLRPRHRTARLWPQTEWLKAACILGDAAQADAAAASLWRYLETPRAGLWRDKMQEDGSFLNEPAPASSLYHIICAVASLRDFEH